MIYHMKAVPICGTVFEEGWMSCCSVVFSVCALLLALDAKPYAIVSNCIIVDQIVS